MKERLGEEFLERGLPRAGVARVREDAASARPVRRAPRALRRHQLRPGPAAERRARSRTLTDPRIRGAVGPAAGDARGRAVQEGVVVVGQGARATLLKHLSIPGVVGPLLLQEFGQPLGAVRALPPDKVQPVLRLSGQSPGPRRGEDEVRDLREAGRLRRVELPEVPSVDDVKPREGPLGPVRAPPPRLQGANQLPEPPIGLRQQLRADHANLVDDQPSALQTPRLGSALCRGPPALLLAPPALAPAVVHHDVQGVVHSVAGDEVRHHVLKRHELEVHSGLVAHPRPGPTQEEMAHGLRRRCLWNAVLPHLHLQPLNHRLQEPRLAGR